MELSIVIPAFEESGKIAHDIKKATDFLTINELEGEIIVVDDGSTDNTDGAAKNVVLPPEVKLRVFKYEHRGKGHAVSKGIAQSCGRYVMFADSGSCVPYENAIRGLDLLKRDLCDIAHGSRKMTGSYIEKAQGLFRRFCSRLFRLFSLYFMKIPASLTDTQCGFKIYKGDIARRLYSKCTTDGFSFDIEIILLAMKYGYRIKEFPVEWVCDIDSRLSPVRSVRRILRELNTIKRTVNKQ
jgi:dolichyl-phosphate beta-glucosyltransferase